MREVTTRWRPLSIALCASWPGLWSYNGEIQGGKLCLLKCPEHTTPSAVALEWRFYGFPWKNTKKIKKPQPYHYEFRIANIQVNIQINTYQLKEVNFQRNTIIYEEGEDIGYWNFIFLKNLSSSQWFHYITHTKKIFKFDQRFRSTLVVYKIANVTCRLRHTTVPQMRNYSED